MSTHKAHQSSPRRARIAAATALSILFCGVALGACGGSSSSSGANSAGVVHSSTQVTVAAAHTSAGVAHHGGTAVTQTAVTTAENQGAAHTTSANANANNSSGSKSGTIPANPPNNGKFPPAFVAAVRTFVTCVRSHGLSINEPNFSGHGEIFNKASVNPNNPNYRSALQSCESDLIAILRAAAGTHISGLTGG